MNAVWYSNQRPVGTVIVSSWMNTPSEIRRSRSVIWLELANGL
jgi:hypothetical protein